MGLINHPLLNRLKMNFIALILLVFQIPAYTQGTLLVANKNEHTVSVISLSQNQEIAKIQVGVGPHELAVSPDGKLAVSANYGNKQSIGNTLTVMDVSVLKALKEISLGDYNRPHGIEFINENEILVTCEANQVLLKVNISDGKITEVAKTNQLLSHMVAYSAQKKQAFVANITSGTVSMIDIATNRLLRQLEFNKGIEGVTVSPDGKEVWVANREDSTVTAMSTTTFEKLGVMPAHQVAYRIKFLPNGKHVVVSNGMSGNLGVYNVKDKKLIKDIDLRDLTRPTTEENPNMPVPVGIAVSTDSKFVYVSMAGYNQVAVISTKNWKVEKVIDTGNGPDGIYYSTLN